ncbi:unnamed protein product, partial [Closterium sp. Naga37s-1]
PCKGGKSASPRTVNGRNPFPRTLMTWQLLIGACNSTSDGCCIPYFLAPIHPPCATMWALACPPSPPYKLPRLKAVWILWASTTTRPDTLHMQAPARTGTMHMPMRSGGKRKAGCGATSIISMHCTHMAVECDGRLIGQQAASPWLYKVPWGFEKLLMHITTTYNAPPIYITENGLDEEDDPSLPLHVATNDPHRIRFYHAYLSHLLAAIRQGADVRGYMAWSWMDNFEWQMGYSRRFGIVHVDRSTHGLKRTPKVSALWWQRLLSGMPVHGS